MVPNITHGSGFGGLLRYLLLDPDGVTPRHGAELLGGTLAGRNLAELLGEFSLVRRLRPRASMVVMHHSLSYASEEDPTDAQIQRDSRRYLEHLGLQDFPYVIVRHADKDHLHPHLVISKIGFGREWWDARLDEPRAQVSAALVEREFGLVEVERPKMRNRIEAAWARLGKEPPGGVLATPGGIRLPGPDEVLPVPPKRAEKVPPALEKPGVGEDGILQQLRARMEEIPAGLSLPDWVSALEVEGVQVRPSIGGNRISGWWVQFTGSDVAPVKLSAVDRARSVNSPRRPLGWAALLKTGDVNYDPDQHLEFAKQLAEVPFDRPLGFSFETTPTGPYPRESVTLVWDWQPVEPTPRLERPGMVGELVGQSLRIGAPGAGRERPGQPQVRGGEKAPVPPRPRLVQDRSPSPYLAPRIRALVAGVSCLPSEGRSSHRPGYRIDLGGGVSFSRSKPGVATHLGQSAHRPGSLPRGRDYGKASSGYKGHENLHGGPTRGIPAPTRRSPGGGFGGGRDGMRLDRGGLEAIRHQKALEAARNVIFQLSGRAMMQAKSPSVCTRTRTGVSLIPVSQRVREAMNEALARFSHGEFHQTPEPRQRVHAKAGNPEPYLVLEGMGEVDIVSPAERTRRVREEPKTAEPPASPPVKISGLHKQRKGR